VGFGTQLDPVVPVTYSDGYQTFGSLLRPNVPPPTCGWPLVVFVHPLGRTRADDFGLQTMIAAQGYAVWSYDVRAHGQALAANPTHPQGGSTLWGPIERIDLAEQILFVGGNVAWTGSVDATRVAVVGSSQGGVHAWNAAAFSGQPLTVPGRPTLTFPAIACVAANDYVAEPIQDWLRGGLLWSSWFLEALAGSFPGTPIDAAFLQTARNAFLNQDPASLLQAFDLEGRGIVGHLQVSTVPVLYSHAYHDQIDSPLPTLALLQTMPGPHRAMLSTIGHNTPQNLHERAFRDGVILRWLHRYLWAEQNEVDVEPPFVLSELPLERSLREDVNYPWSRHHGVDPLLVNAPLRLFLHDDLTLRDVAPTVPQALASIDQVVDPQATTFTPADYLNNATVRSLTGVLAACPLDEVVYATTIVDERQIDASAAVHLRLVPDRADWMVAALLTVQPPGVGTEEVMLASAAVASATSLPGIAEEHDFRLPPVAARVPAGGIVRLRLRNLWVREAPMAMTLEVAPRFHDFHVGVEHGGPTGGSWLDLPLHPVRPKLSTTTTWFPLATAPAVNLSVRGGVARAGNPYFLTTGVSGHLPATPFLNDLMPLENDWLVGIVSAAWVQPEFTNFLGILDANGEATATMDFGVHAPLPPALTGLRLSYAAFVFDSMLGLSGAASNACDVFLQ
jgi:alpha-beta hydrolase superfamily lysophospholipase